MNMEQRKSSAHSTSAIMLCYSSHVMFCRSAGNYWLKCFKANYEEFRSVYEQYTELLHTFRTCRKTCLHAAMNVCKK
jgi:hypothetical protein